MIMEPKKRTRLASMAVLFLVLAAGFLLGVAWDRTLVATPSEQGERVRDERDDRERGERRLIVDRVGLTAEQKAQVDSIVAYHREQMDAIQDSVAPRFRAVVQATRASIKEVLTPEQRIQYDSLLAEHDRRREDRRDSSRESKR